MLDHWRQYHWTRKGHTIYNLGNKKMIQLFLYCLFFRMFCVRSDGRSLRYEFHRDPLHHIIGPVSGNLLPSGPRQEAHNQKGQSLDQIAQNNVMAKYRQFYLSNVLRWAKLLSLGGRYCYKLLAKKRLQIQLQVTVLKSMAVKVTS